MIDGIIGVVGPEGGGKSVLMTYFCLLQMAQKGKLLTFPGYTVTDGRGHQLSEELNIEDWLTFAPELRNVLIAIDEIQNFFNSLKHMSTLNYLFANLAAQRRHRNIGLIYTVQDWGWLDNRIRWLTHVLATCYDLYWSPWGKEQGLKRGELISVSLFDIKGFYTGKPWQPGPQFMLKATEIWNCFDSYCDVDVFSGMTKIKYKKPEITLDLTGGEEEEVAPVPSGAMPSAPDNSIELLNELAAQGVKPTTLGKVGRLVRR